MNGFELIKKAGIKDAVALILNKEFKDLCSEIPSNISDEEIEFVLKSSQDGLDIIRHSTAHLMAAAIKRLFPNTIFAIGPSIENGFYYDMDFGSEKFSENDFVKVEEEMKKIVKEDLKFVRKEVEKEEALELFKDNKFKIEIINELPVNQPITLYYLGDYVDLCRGPHVPSTRYLPHFKLTKVSGVYWRADAEKEQLQRVYGTAWDNQEKLNNWFKLLAESEKRDHKKICKAMDLVHWEPEYAPGAAFWHPKGWFLWQTLISWLRSVKFENGYTEAHTPRVMNRILWEISGHWDNYGDKNYGGKTQDEMQFSVKPMNCPGGILIYNSSPKSYRDLPIRLAEFGEVNRFEASGSLNGLLRCREFTQDDAHVWCSEDQLEEEIINMHNMFFKEVYNVLGFSIDNCEMYLSLRPSNRIGSDEKWDKAEQYMKNVFEKNNLKVTLCPGEGAFYGPKIEYHFKDAMGRMWQIGTIQLDMNLPERFKMSYIGKDGQKHTPCMLHAACFGALDRFLGMYIETIEGKFPLWMNPLQCCILSISEKTNDYCEELFKQFKKAGMRVEKDLSDKKIQQKIAIHSLEKIPYLLIVGDKEKENNTVSIRIFGKENASPIVMNVSEFINKINEKVINKSLDFEI